MHFRTIFLSDIHLGSRGCSATQLLNFFKNNDADTIYLIGDIIDVWQMKARLYWPQTHNDIVQKILRKARKGTNIIYVPGNHDEFLRNHVGLAFGGIQLRHDAVHVTARGVRLWITHGDEFDCITSYHRWLAIMGDIGYTFSLTLNRNFNRLRRLFGLGHWSLAAYLKRSVKRAVQFIGNYEEAVRNECLRRNFDGVICGHIHHAELRQQDGLIYANCGDFVESCTALVEHHDGRLELLSLLGESCVSITTLDISCA